MNREKIFRNFRKLVIPAEIWFEEKLNVFEKCLWSEIYSLHKIRGCYADNAYLAKFFRVDIRTIQRYIKDMVDKGFLEVFMKNKVRYLTPYYESSIEESIVESYPDKNVIKNATKLSDDGDKTVVSDTRIHINKVNEMFKKRKEKQEKEKAPDGDHSLRSFNGPSKKNLHGEFSNVLLTDDELAKLVEKCTKPLVEVLIQDLSHYMESKGVKYKSHYATLLNWFRKRQNEKQSPGKGLAQKRDSFDSSAFKPQIKRFSE